MATREYDPTNGRCAVETYSLDSDSGLLVISYNSELAADNIAPRDPSWITINIVDEDDDLEWTLTFPFQRESTIANYLSRFYPYRRLGLQSGVIKARILSASASHRIAVSVLMTCKSLTSDGTESFQVKRRLTGVARHLGGGMLSGLYDSKFPVFDLRPRLPGNVTVSIIQGCARHILFTIPVDALLPAENSAFRYPALSNLLNFEILQEDKDDPLASARKIYSRSFPLNNPRKLVSTSLKIEQDGSLSATIGQGQDNTETITAPRIINVTSPKTETDKDDPNLEVKWTRNVFLRTDQSAALHISTTYQKTQINRWRISISKTRSATIDNNFIFLVPVEGFTQTFDIPSDALALGGVSYDVKVEGLQRIEEQRGVHSVFKVVCSKSVTTLTQADYSSDVSSVLYNRLQSLHLNEKAALTDSTQDTNIVAIPDRTNLTISIERETFNEAAVVIDCEIAETSPGLHWKVTVTKTHTVVGKLPDYIVPPQEEFKVPATRRRQKYEIPLTFQPGNSYRVTVQADGRPNLSKTVDFRAELTLSDIKELHTIALREAIYGGNGPCHYLYRNKSQAYFDNIERNRGGIMEIYDKDNSGDQASPINLQIKGLFFMASIQSGQPNPFSPFGPRRVLIPATELLAMASNLYFVDFYCMRGTIHYVTIVMTEPGSEVDNFCAQRLLPLDIHDQVNNPFLFYDSFGQLNVSTRDRMFVELFYTKDIDITRYRQVITPTVGKGSSTPGGVPKNRLCPLCNLKRVARYRQL